MPIRFHCDDCRAKIRVPEGAEGRKVKCPRCGAVHRVPEQVQEKQPAVAAVAENESAFEPQNSEEGSELDSLASAADADDYSESADDEQPEVQDEQPEDDQDEDDDAGDEDQPEKAYDPTLIDLPGEGEDQNEEDPLAALAAMTDDEDEQESPDNAFSEDLEPDAEDQEGRGALFEEPDADEPDLNPSASSLVADAPKRAVPVPIAKSKLNAGPADETHGSDERSGPESEARPNVPSPQPRGIPLSNKPSTGRPTAKPIPKGEPVPHVAPARSAAASSGKLPFDLLEPLGWVLRVLAVLAVGQTIKLMVTAIMEKWPLGDSLLLLLVGFMATVTVWTVGEIALAVRRLTR